MTYLLWGMENNYEKTEGRQFDQLYHLPSIPYDIFMGLIII